MQYKKYEKKKKFTLAKKARQEAKKYASPSQIEEIEKQFRKK